MSNPTTDEVTANPGTGGPQFAGWLISSVFWPLSRLAFGSGRTSNEVDAAPGQRLPVQGGGTVGVDHSENLPTAPDYGSAFASGPYNGWTPISIVPANPNRAQIRVQNDSLFPVAIVLDDGTATTGNPMEDFSVFNLPSGGLYIDQTEHGRVQVYALASNDPRSSSGKPDPCGPRCISYFSRAAHRRCHAKWLRQA